MAPSLVRYVMSILCEALGAKVKNGQMVKIVPSLQFHKKVRTTSGLAPTSQLPWWCYVENERTNWERNGLIETPTLRGVFARQMQNKARKFSQLSNWKTSLLLLSLAVSKWDCYTHFFNCFFSSKFWLNVCCANMDGSSLSVRHKDTFSKRLELQPVYFSWLINTYGLPNFWSSGRSSYPTLSYFKLISYYQFAQAIFRIKAMWSNWIDLMSGSP